MIRFLSAVVLMVPMAVAQQTPQFDGQSWWNHVKILADDKMEGRETGSEGLRKASEYVQQQLTQAGLQPAGTKGFYQPVSFTARQIIEKDSHAMLVRNGTEEPIVLGEDAYFATSIDVAPDEVSAPLVFVGYGLKIPELNLDDLAGVDLKNKVVVYISGSPASLPSALSAHYQQSGVRWKALRDAGAIGAIRIFNPASMDIPWSRISLNRAHVEMTLADPEFDETAGEKIALGFNPAKAEKLFADSGHSFQEIADLARDRKELPRFPLAVSLKAKAKVEKQMVESSNIVAKLPGSDPKLKDEYVVLSAHLDHVGI